MLHLAGTAGGEAQQADITQLLKELELKKAKLNELRGESRKAEADIAKIRDDDTDAQRLTPDGCVVENNYIQVSTQAAPVSVPAACTESGCKLNLAHAGVPLRQCEGDIYICLGQRMGVQDSRHAAPTCSCSCCF